MAGVGRSWRKSGTTVREHTREIQTRVDGDVLRAVAELSSRVKALEGRNTDVAGLLQAVQAVIGDHVAREVSGAEQRLKDAIAAYLIDVGNEAERVLKGAA